MNIIVLILCLTFGLSNSFKLSNLNSNHDAVAIVCEIIETRPGPAASFLDRMQEMLNERQQLQVQEYLPRTFAYFMKQENKNKLKAGGESCKTFFSDMKIPVTADLQGNKELLQFIQQIVNQQIMDEHIKHLINAIIQQYI
ncbi:hypothetical protein I4U23_023017 [Adineta vaga]|nr:hypothetical protein I4U23_023017 [Adineta vaga]